MKLSKCILAGVMMGCGSLAWSQGAATASSAQNKAARIASSNTQVQEHAATVVQRFSFHTFNPHDTIGHFNMYEFNEPDGFSWGNAGGWSVQHGTSEKGTFNTRGIGQMYVSDSVKHATGDFAAQYVYASTDGGATAQSDEGFTLDTREGGETDKWFHGTVGPGAVAGTTLLPMRYVAGAQSQETTTDGAYMLDLTKGTISGIVTGRDTLVEGTSVHIMPVSANLPPSRGIGIVNTPIPKITQEDHPETITLSGIRLIRGSFVTGKACLAGGWYPEQVLITKVGAAVNGLQDVTIVHKNPNERDVQNPTSLWQGGICGQYLSLDRNLARDGFRTSYEVVGATDSNHLAYVFNVKGGTVTNELRVYKPPVLLRNLSRSHGIVTASFAYANQPYIFNHAASVVIADASNPSFNGTVHLPEYGHDLNVKLKWSQAGPDATSSSATIDLPASYYGFHLYPGAEVMGPRIAGGVPLEPNSVDWAPGDLLENPHNPSFAMYGRMTQLVQHTLSSGNNSNGQVWGFRGAGISANYFPSMWINDNPCSLYIGCGGTLEPIRWDTFKGPYSELIAAESAPLNQGIVISIDCDPRGCDHLSPYRLFQLQNGKMDYDPADGNFTVPRMTANLFSGRLDGQLKTTQIELQDPRSSGRTVTITNSNGQVVIRSPTQERGNGVGDSFVGLTGREAQDRDYAEKPPAAATIMLGPSDAGGSATCTKGYLCTARRGRITVGTAVTAKAGTLAIVKTPLGAGEICTATQNGGSSFMGIGSGNESTNGFEITAGVVPRGVVTVDYDCR